MARRRQSYLMRGGNITPITAKGIVTNPSATSDFYGLSEGNFEPTPENVAKLFLASIWAARCLRVKARKVSSIPLEVGFDDPAQAKGDPKAIAAQAYLKGMFGQRITRVIRHTEYDLGVFGEAFWEKRGLRRLNPITMFPEKSPGAGVTGYAQKINGQVIAKFGADEIVYFYDYNPQNDLAGASPLKYAMYEIGVDEQIAQVVFNFFANDATPTGILTTDRQLGDADMLKTYTWWQKLLRGVRNKGKMGILDNGLSYQQIQAAINDLAVKDLRYEDRRAICAALDVPMTIALADESANFAVSDQEHLAFYTETIQPDLDFILETINEQLACQLHRRLRVTADYSAVEVLQVGRAAITTRALQGFQAGLRSFNEARELEGLKPFPDDFFYIPGVGVVTPQELSTARIPTPQLMPGYPVPGQGGQPGGNPQPPSPSGGNGSGGGGQPQLPAPTAPQQPIAAHNIRQTVDDALAANAIADLERWRTKAAKKGAQAPFESRYIPKAIAMFLRRDLEVAVSGGDVAAAFSTAKAWLRSTDPTPAEFEFYWKDFDDVAQEFVNEIAHWFEGLPLAERAAERITATATKAVDDVNLDDLISPEETEALIKLLVGTQGQAGPQTKLFLAGAARGAEILDALTAKKAGGSIAVSWDLINQQALGWSQGYDYNLVKGMNEATADAFRQVMGSWIDGGGNYDNLVQAVKGELGGLDIPDGWSRQKIEWATSTQRARLIAQTESTRVFAQGNVTHWQNNNVKAVRARTQNDKPVCPTCRGLNNQETELVAGVEPLFTWNGKTYRIPVHPGCRCFLQPIVMNVNNPLIAKPVPVAPAPAALAPAPVPQPQPKAPAPQAVRPPVAVGKPAKLRPAPLKPSALTAREIAFQKAIDPAATRSARELPTVAELKTAPTKQLSNMNINNTTLAVVDGRRYFVKADLEPLGARSEAAYAKYADIMGIGDHTPAVSVLEEGKGQSSLVAEYLDGYGAMNVKVGFDSKPIRDWVNKNLTAEDISRILVTDYVAGQTDRHAGNIMVNDSGGWQMIDNTATFGVDVRGGPRFTHYSHDANQWMAPRFLQAFTSTELKLTKATIEDALSHQKAVYKLLKNDLSKDAVLGAQARFGNLETIYNKMEADGLDEITMHDAIKLITGP